MPQRDGLGPNKIGRKMGFCTEENANKQNGCGLGRRKRMGKNLDCNYKTPPKDELSLLKQQSEAVENHLSNIKNRIIELESRNA